MRNFKWREWLHSAVRLWRTSLLTRTVSITLLLSTVAVGVIGAYISISVGTNLFDARRDQLLAQAARATSTVQNAFNLTTGQGSTVNIEDATSTAYSDVLQSNASTAGTQIAILRTPGQSGPRVPIDVATTSGTKTLVSSALRKTVADSTNSRVYWQSITIPGSAGSQPGIVIGSSVALPKSGKYELYLVYNLSDSEQTLSFVQSTLVLGGLALILLIGAVTWVVVRLVVGPIRVAAETAQRLAGGELEQRIPERGDDVIATLARSFNGMADSLQKQIVRLATLSQVQQRFVSDVSHELRTPLTTIRLAGDVLY
ncbi:MAG TPA: HAMP domain-containing protein, partial [Galbitalea sp.]|nr:HAMP domain-containing protein [Galbitalea sp.]